MRPYHASLNGFTSRSTLQKVLASTVDNVGGIALAVHNILLVETLIVKLVQDGFDHFATINKFNLTASRQFVQWNIPRCHLTSVGNPLANLEKCIRSESFVEISDVTWAVERHVNLRVHPALPDASQQLLSALERGVFAGFD